MNGDLWLEALRGEVWTEGALRHVALTREMLRAGHELPAEVVGALADGDTVHRGDPRRYVAIDTWHHEVDVDPATTDAFERLANSQNYDTTEHEAAEQSAVERLESALLTTDEVVALPPPDPLIEGLLMRDTLAIAFGPSGVGKTFLAVDWAFHVATRSTWNGRSVHAGPVFYVIAEGAAGIGRRVDAWGQHHRIYQLDQHQPVTWLPRRINLFDRVEVEAFANIAARLKPVLVVFDTLHRCLLGVEENSAKDIGVVIEHLDIIRRSCGACVLAVHHSGKDLAQGGRGSSALRGAVDTEIEVTGDETVTVKVKKQKDGAEAPPIQLRRVPAAESCVLTPAAKVAPTETLTPGDLDTLEALRAVIVPGGVPDSVWKEKALESCAKSTYYVRRSKLLARRFVLNLGTDARPRYVIAEDEPSPGS